MNNRKKVWIVGFVVLMLFGLAGCGGTQVALDSVEVEMQQESCLTDGVDVELVYPVVSSTEDADALMQTLNAQFRENAETFQQLVKEQYAQHAKPEDLFEYQADVLFNQDGMLSIVEGLRCGEDYQQYAATYSLTDGHKMTLGELMGMSEQEAEATVIQQFDGVIQSYPDSFHADAVDYVSAHIDEVQYYRYNEGMGIFFPVGVIAPDDMGVQEMVMQ